MPGFRFDGYGKHFDKPGKLGKRWRHENHAIPTFPRTLIQNGDRCLAANRKRLESQSESRISIRLC